jgi:hypothetical protein
MPDGSADPSFRQALDALAGPGLLFLHDVRRPSLTALVAGAPIRGSWWGHPAGKRIFQVAGALEDHGDVLFVPLLSAKVTLVHRGLWPALLGVGMSRAPWQMAGLEDRARKLLEEVERDGRVRATGPSSKALARALLVHAEQVHTDRGSHATELVSWRVVQQARGGPAPLEPGAAREALESAAAAIGAVAALPWKRKR